LQNTHAGFNISSKLDGFYFMESYELDHLTITLNKEGSREFSKVSFPMRHGLFSEVRTPEYLFQFNLNGEIKFIQGLTRIWPHPAEWLKRTIGNDWAYYSAGDYKGIHDYFGEYYFPYLSYPSNSIMDGNPFNDPSVILAKQSLQATRLQIDQLISSSKLRSLKDFLTRVLGNNEGTLKRRADQLHRLIGGQVTVLPPDTRHVDYDVIPLIVADGCLYHCGFCRVKTGQDFTPRPARDVIRQMEDLKRFLGQDLHNYNAIFLGQHDALSSGRALLEVVIERAYEIFEFERSHLRGTCLFLFGSVDSMIDVEEGFFESLNRSPFSTYINVGLESNDPSTLEALKKPISVEKIREAFTRMLEINRRYEKIEVTSNFVFGGDLPSGHLPSLSDLTRNRVNLISNKGAVYLSPLVGEGMKDKKSKRELLRRFLKLKTETRLPAFIYLIQRL
jgi:hypothetical protein